MLKRKEVTMNNGIYRVISEGTSLIGNHDLNEATFRIWLDYSLKMMGLVCSNSYVKYQYSSFALRVANSSRSPLEKLHQCVDYLINMAPMI